MGRGKLQWRQIPLWRGKGGGSYVQHACAIWCPLRCSDQTVLQLVTEDMASHCPDPPVLPGLEGAKIKA